LRLRMPDLKMVIRMGIVGVLIVVAMALSDIVWAFVTGFIVPFTGGLGLVSILIGFLLWFVGMAFMAFVIVWVLGKLHV